MLLHSGVVECSCKYGYSSGFGNKGCVQNLKGLGVPGSNLLFADKGSVAAGCAQLSFPLQSQLMQAVCFLRKSPYTALEQAGLRSPRGDASVLVHMA